MAMINLRVLYPAYQLDCSVDVPDEDVEAFITGLTEEVAAIYFNFQQKESAYNRRVFWNKAHYSLDRNDGIENNIPSAVADPIFEEYLEQLIKEQLYAAISSLPDKQAKRIYANTYWA